MRCGAGLGKAERNRVQATFMAQRAQALERGSPCCLVMLPSISLLYDTAWQTTTRATTCALLATFEIVWVVATNV